MGDGRARNSRRLTPHEQWAEWLLLAGLILVLFARIPGAERSLPSARALTHRVDLNQATWRELVVLPGIGPARANAIVSDRERRGPYERPLDLLRVKGIGPATVAGLRAFVKGGD